MITKNRFGKLVEHLKKQTNKQTKTNKDHFGLFQLLSEKIHV